MSVREGCAKAALLLATGEPTIARIENNHERLPSVIEVKLAYGLVEAARAIGVSRSVLYQLKKQGALRFVKCRGRTLILHEDLMAFLQSLR